MALAGRPDTIIYTMGLVHVNDPDQNPRVLRRLAETTGGQTSLPKPPAEAPPVLEQIARDIRIQGSAEGPRAVRPGAQNSQVAQSRDFFLLWTSLRLLRRGIVVTLLLASGFLFLGCGKKKVTINPPVAGGPASPTPAPDPTLPGSTQEGIASWYGHPYHGRRTANGEVYDMMKDTAAHQTLPFGTRVKVTNLENQRSTEVRINDRGPFVDGRIIDLSRKAAEEIHMVGPGTARVRIEILSPGTEWKGRFAVQVGAFRNRENADRLKRALDSEFEGVSVQEAPGGVHRVRVGRLEKRSEAERLANRLRRNKNVQGALVIEIP